MATEGTADTERYSDEKVQQVQRGYSDEKMQQVQIADHFFTAALNRNIFCRGENKGLSVGKWDVTMICRDMQMQKHGEKP